MENRLKNEIVGLIAAGVMVKRSSINVLHPSPKYIEKTVSQLYSDGVIRRAPGKVLRLTPRGISLLDEDERQLYMALSCGNRPGNDKSHVDAATRASDCLAVMYAAGIPAGFYKNEFEFKNDSVEPSYKTSFEFKSVEPSEFVLKKELMEPGQRQRRMDGSRASGYLFASGIAATVISTMGRNLKLNHRGEFSARWRQSIGSAASHTPATESINASSSARPMTTACASSRIAQRLTRWLGKCVTSISRISSTDISLRRRTAYGASDTSLHTLRMTSCTRCSPMRRLQLRMARTAML